MKGYPPSLVISVVLALVLSGVAPHDRTTWWLEIFPVLIGSRSWSRPIVAFLSPHCCTPCWPSTRSSSWWAALHVRARAARVLGPGPLGFARNHYDRLGHFAQGFIPAILVREILLRTSPLRSGRWLFVLVTAMCLAFSACYEFIEWWTALIGGQSADAFLGTQGDVWDTQWDMLFALIGAVTAQLLLTHVHDRAVARLAGSTAARNPV